MALPIRSKIREGMSCTPPRTKQAIGNTLPKQTRNKMDSDKVMNLVTQLNYVSDELEEDLGRGGIKGKSVCRFALLLRCPCHVFSVWLWSVRLPPGPGPTIFWIGSRNHMRKKATTPPLKAFTSA